MHSARRNAEYHVLNYLNGIQTYIQDIGNTSLSTLKAGADLALTIASGGGNKIVIAIKTIYEFADLVMSMDSAFQYILEDALSIKSLYGEQDSASVGIDIVSNVMKLADADFLNNMNQFLESQELADWAELVGMNAKLADAVSALGSLLSIVPPIMDLAKSINSCMALDDLLTTATSSIETYREQAEKVQTIADNIDHALSSETVASGNTLSNQSVTSIKNVYGTIASSTVYAGGSLNIREQGASNNCIVESGGAMNIYSGGLAASVTVRDGGTLWIYEGGAALSVTVEDGGRLYVMKGGACGAYGPDENLGLTEYWAQVADGAYVFVDAEAYLGVLGNESSRFDHFYSEGAWVNGLPAVSGSGIPVDDKLFTEDRYQHTSSFTGDSLIQHTVFDVDIVSGKTVITDGGKSVQGVIQKNASQILSSGESFHDDIHGSQIISSGGKASYCTIHASGEQTVYGGGEAYSTTISDGGVQLVGSGSIYSSVNSINTFTCGQEAVASNTVIESGGIQFVLSGGFAGHTVISAGGSQDIRGGTTEDTLVSSGGSISFWKTGTADELTILAGGKVTEGSIDTILCSSGGFISGASYSAGAMHLTSGAAASNVMIGYSGIMHVSSGGIIYDTTIKYKGTQYIHKGGTATYTYIYSGTQVVLENGSSIDTTFGFVGSQTVFGLAENTILTSGSNRQFVSSGGSSHTTVISSGSYQIVEDGGFARNTTIYAVGEQHISGGLSMDTYIHQYGRQYVYSGGSAYGVRIYSDGWQTIFSGGTGGAVIFSGGEQKVYGTADGTVVSSGGEQHVYSGGTAVGTIVSSGGWQCVSSGGTAAATIHAGGEQTVYSGGIADGTVVRSGGAQYVSFGGIADGTVVSSGGAVYIYAGGSASHLTISAGGQVENILVSSGGLIAGASFDGDVMHIRSGMTASRFSISDGAVLVSAGGSTSLAAVSSHASQIVRDKGTANGTVLEGYGACQILSSGGTAVDTVVSSGGSQVVLTGARVSASVIKAGGSQRMSSGGAAVGGNVAGTQAITAGASAASMVIYGRQNVTGKTYGTTVRKGGVQTIYAGGHAQSSVVSS